ncbi:MAG TPA: hypothetical protein VGM16_03190, partial [Gammaproteobacteria bacterium]
MRIAVFLFSAAFLSTSAAADFDFENSPPQLNSEGTLDLGSASSIVSVSISDTDSDDFGDGRLLTLATKGKKVTYPFDAAYGMFHLYVVSLSGFRSPEVVLVHAEGRGTSASTWVLDVLTLADDKIVSEYKKDVASFFGSGELWWYSISFTDAAENTATVDLRLGLDHSPLTHDSLEIPG